MSDHPSREVPRDLVGVIASLFSGGNGPTHSQLDTATSAAGINAEWPGGPKDARVSWVFRQASRDQAYRFIDELLILIRNSSEFRRVDSEWVPRAREAFRRAGGTLDGHGYLTWGDEGTSSPAAATAVAAGMIADMHRDLTGRADTPVGAVAEVSNQIARHETSEERDRAAVEDAVARFVVPPQEAVAPRRNSAGAEDPGPQAADSVAPRGRDAIFLVHGRDEAARDTVDVFIRNTTGIRPIILQAQASGGKTIIEKFEEHAGAANFAVVLLTGDDIGQTSDERDQGRAPEVRGRQNVILEYGYFIGRLGRNRVVPLVGADVVVPSDLAGVGYISFGPTTPWREELRREMRGALLPILD